MFRVSVPILRCMLCGAATRCSPLKNAPKYIILYNQGRKFQTRGKSDKAAVENRESAWRSRLLGLCATAAECRRQPAASCPSTSCAELYKRVFKQPKTIGVYMLLVMR